MQRQRGQVRKHAMTKAKPAEQHRGAAPDASNPSKTPADVERLLALRERLNADVENLRPTDADRTPYGGDFESLVTAAQIASQHETDELLRRRLERRISELDRVHRRLEQGSYGRCEACGAEIPKERLEAVPDARLCIPCQRQRERRGTWRRAA
jgi:DnaK suppressor protein